MDQSFLEKPENEDIIALLAVSSLPLMEKRLWVNALEHMTSAEKTQLKANLEEEVGYEAKVTEQALNDFFAALKNPA